MIFYTLSKQMFVFRYLSGPCHRGGWAARMGWVRVGSCSCPGLPAGTWCCPARSGLLKTRANTMLKCRFWHWHQNIFLHFPHWHRNIRVQYLIISVMLHITTSRATEGDVTCYPACSASLRTCSKMTLKHRFQHYRDVSGRWWKKRK